MASRNEQLISDFFDGSPSGIKPRTRNERLIAQALQAGGGSGADCSFLHGLKYYALGDSIVDMQGTLTAPETFGDTGYNTDLQNRNIADITVEGYVTAIERRFGLVATNYGKGGQTLVGGYATLVALDYSDVALVTIAYGVNDARTGVPLGTVNSEDITTFAGALNMLLRKIYTDNPECRVVVLTPIQRLYVSNFGVATPNANGNYLVDFVDMCKKVAAKRSTKCIDMYQDCGINQTNLYYYTVEGVHPVNQGFARMRGAVIPVLDEMFAMEFEPFGVMTNTGDTEPDEPEPDVPVEPPVEDTDPVVVDLSRASVTDGKWLYDNWAGSRSKATEEVLGPILLNKGATYTIISYGTSETPGSAYSERTWVIMASAEFNGQGARCMTTTNGDYKNAHLGAQNTVVDGTVSIDGTTYYKYVTTFAFTEIAINNADETYYLWLNRHKAIELSEYSLTYI